MLLLYIWYYKYNWLIYNRMSVYQNNIKIKENNVFKY